MNTTRDYPDPFPPEVSSAIDSVTLKHQADVQRFALKFVPGGAIEDSVFVMVFCGRQDPVARELIDLLRTLESEIVTEAFRLGFDKDLTLMLSPNMAA